MTRSKLEENQWAVEHAIAQQELEGLAVSPEMAADLKRVSKGEIAMDMVIHNLYARYAHVKVLEL